MESKRIPLFPLEVVLFPGAPLPLHIFESRYKLMVRHCLQNHEKFGVILARGDGIAPVGCTAQIVQLLKQYEDGRMDILTVGQTAYRVLEVFDDQPYLEGAVEYLEDADAPVPPEIQEQLRKEYEQCHLLLYSRGPGALETPPQASLAFQIASELPLEIDCKQELLEMRSESARQRHLLERLKRWLPQLTELHRLRGRAGGNGHGPV